MEAQTFVRTMVKTLEARNNIKWLKKRKSLELCKTEEVNNNENCHIIGHHQLTRQQINEFRQAFDILDQNGDGNVSKEELRRVMKAFGLNARTEELDLMVVDGGNIDFDTFVDLTWPSEQEEDELKEAFRVFDRKGRGYITAIDLKKFMRCFGEELAEDEIEELIKEADTDGDGRIDFYEFVAALDF